MLAMTIPNFDYIKEKFSKEILVKWTARKVLILKQKYFFLGFKKSLKKYLQFYEFFQKVNIIAICVSNVWVSFRAWNMYLRQGRCLLKIWEKRTKNNTTIVLSHEKCSASFAVFYTSFPESVVDKARSKTALELESRRPIISVPYSGVAKGRNYCVFKNNTI